MRIFKVLVFSLYNIINFCIFKIKKVSCKTSLWNVKGLIKVKGSGSILLDEGVKLNSGQTFNPIGGDGQIVFVAVGNAKIAVGKNSGLSNCCLFAKQKITIDENVMIGGSVKIYDTDFHSLNYLDRREKNLDIQATISKPVHIHSDVFVGAHSIILKGVTIGRGAVIGSGSIVTQSVPSFQVWAGNPAKFIKDIS